METIKAQPRPPANPEAAARIARVMAEIIATRLVSHPHYVVLRGGEASEDLAWATLLCRTLSSLAPQKPAQDGKDGVSTTRVRIKTGQPGHRSSVTRFSRTNLPLPPHTDSSYLADPHEVVAFQVVSADAAGGDTAIVPIEDLLARLPGETIAALREPQFPFGRGRFPVLFGEPGKERIRYYRAQIELALEAGESLPTAAAAALKTLDSLLARQELAIKFKLLSGDVLFLNNKMALHGRDGFTADSNRLLFRLRAHAGRLA